MAATPRLFKVGASFADDVTLGAVGKRLYLSPAGVSILESSGRVYTSAGITTDGTIAAAGLAGSLLSTATPQVDSSSGGYGSSAIPARQDHYHPVDTSRAAVAQTFYLGTTQIAINRSSGALSLDSITLNSPGLTGTVLADDLRSVALVMGAF